MNLVLKSQIVRVFRTQDDFAIRVGVNPSVVSRVIHARYKLRPEQKSQWAEALSTTINELFEEEASK